MPYYPMKRPNGSYQVSKPHSQSRLLQPIIPQASRDHNVAGQIKTLIHLKNARGEEMSIYQTQQVLNLLNGDTGHWEIGRNVNHQKRRNRK